MKKQMQSVSVEKKMDVVRIINILMYFFFVYCVVFNDCV